MPKNQSSQLKDELDAIRDTLERMKKEDGALKKAFDTLYLELEQYKSEFVFSFEKQLLLDLLTFYDSMIWFRETLKDAPENTDENLDYLLDEFLELLRRRDVAPFPATAEFDRKLHRVIQVTDTENQEDDGKIEKILRRGFFRGERQLRDEEVVIYRHQPAQEMVEEEESSETESGDDS